jgi:hypothetical protein
MPAPPPGLGVRQRPAVPARARAAQLPPNLQRYLETAEKALAEPFTGITVDGDVVPGLFRLGATGVSTRPLLDAAIAFLEALSPEQRGRASFPLDSPAWRQWSNIHPFLMRHGVPLDELTPAQRERGLALVAAGLSGEAYHTARDVMRLNEAVRVITGSDVEYGEWLYWLSVMGTPSADAPWGWQLDGHHLIVNCFVLGDQVVMTPTFMGSEPVSFDEGPDAGRRLFDTEEAHGLTLMRALDAGQRRRAVIGDALPMEVLGAGFRDNLRLPYEGIAYGALSPGQQDLVRRLLGLYVGRMRPGHAEVRLQEVERHLPETHFAWIGGFEEDSVFYYRLHSPVIWIEFDHQRGIAFDNDGPSRHHIHTVVRTPNGNDYGADLLRQHHAQFKHSGPAASHTRG